MAITGRSAAGSIYRPVTCRLVYPRWPFCATPTQAGHRAMCNGVSVVGNITADEEGKAGTALTAGDADPHPQAPNPTPVFHLRPPRVDRVTPRLKSKNPALLTV